MQRTSCDGSWRKFDRAVEHIDAFETRRNAFLNSDFYRLTVDTKVKPGWSFARLDARPAPPGISLVIGDAIHNLRSALDLLAYHIVEQCGSSPPSRKVQFPFSETKDALIRGLANAELRTASQTVADLIINEIKPYPASDGGNDWLFGLHQLDIVDKHRLLLSTVSVTQIRGVHVEGERGRAVKGIMLTLEGGGTMTKLGFPGAMTIVEHGQAFAEITFSEPGAFDGKPVLATLQQLTQLVAYVLMRIEHAYLAGP